MDKNNLVKEIIKNAGGIAKTSDFASAGLKNYEIAAMCNDGIIERVKHGYYQLPAAFDIKEEQLISSLLPQAIVCMESALFHYGYSDFSPRVWSVALSRSQTRVAKNMEAVPIKAYFIRSEFLALGKTTDDFNGVILPLYDRERTICDCFKYRTKLDNELFNKAVNAYAADEKKNLANLSKYAKEMNLFAKIMNVMEVLLNA